jgi:hypothetical protein
MNVEIGTVAAEFLFWEYFFLIFGIGSLQCSPIGMVVEKVSSILHIVLHPNLKSKLIR